MDSDFDDELDDLLADMANGDKKQTKPQVKDIPKAAGPTAPQQGKAPHQGVTESGVLGDLNAGDNDPTDFMSNLLGGGTTSQKETRAQPDTKDPLSDIFEKGAWKQALQQPTAKGDDKAKGDSATSNTFDSREARSDASKQNRPHTVRFSDKPQVENNPTPAKRASKLDDWLQEESAGLGQGSKQGTAQSTRNADRDLTKETPEIGQSSLDNPTAPRQRQRGVVDLSFLSTSTENPSDPKKDTSRTKLAGRQRGKGADWLGLADEEREESGSKENTVYATSRPSTAPEAGTAESAASKGEKAVRQNRKGGGLDWLEVGGDDDPTRKASKAGSGSSRRVGSEGSNQPPFERRMEDIDFGEGGGHARSKAEREPEKVLPWLAGKSSQKTKDTNVESEDRNYIANVRAKSSNAETKSSEARVVENVGTSKEIRSGPGADDAMETRLKTEIANLSSQLRVAEQERDLLQRHVEKLSQMHQMELQNCEDMHRKLQETIEAQLTEQHEKSVRYYESAIRQMEAKVASMDLERARLEGEIGKRTESLRQQCREEVASLQEAHKMALAKLRTEHEEELSRLRRMKNQEVEAVCGTLDQSRNLRCLTDQLGQQHADIKRLQCKLEETIDSDLVRRQDALVARERQLQASEARLRREQEEAKQELCQARHLIAYLQQLNSGQAQQVEEEKWRLRQELAHLHAYKKVQEEKASALEDQLQRQRAVLENVKNNLLREQQSLVAQVASSLKETTREKLDVRANLAVGRASDEVRAARLENRRREIDAAAAELERKRSDVEKMSTSAAELWERCKRRERFLSSWESQLYERESALLKEKVSLLQQRRNTATAAERPQTAQKSTAIVNPTASLWRRKTEEDNAYLQEQSSFLESLKTKPSLHV